MTSDPRVVRPVFIGGCERSGTTLLGSMLGAHPSCVATPESQFKTAVWASLEDPERMLDESARRLVAHWRFRIWGVHVEPDSLPRSSFAAQVCELVRRYAETYGDVGSVWIDHSPNNIRTAATLRELFPEAHFVHLVRDGRAVAASVMPLDWGPNTIWQAAQWWTRRIAYGLALERAWPERVTRVHYEDLVTQPRQTLEALCGALGIPFHDEMLHPRGTRVSPYTEGQHRLVGSAPDPSRRLAYRERLSSRQLELFEAETFELLAYLGYALDHHGRARAATRRETVVALFTEAIRRPVNRLRWRSRRAEAVSPGGGEGPT